MTSDAERRILFVGDMHLGRRPSGVPADLASRLPLGPDEAWRRCVRRARELGVDAVALAGDLVHQENALFEAFGFLENGVRELTAAGIDVCAVAGNHDTDTLPRLAALIPRFRLLGPGGTWSDWAPPPGSGPRVRVVGWSFPASHHLASPLETAPPTAEAGVATFGLLHADLDAPGSRYAPVRGSDLKATGYAGWFLGHVHKPQPQPLPPRGEPFYLGSLSPLDPSESGTHGPLLVTIDPSGDIVQRRLPLAPLRWEHLDWDAAAIGNDLDELRPRLLDHLLRRVDELAESLDGVEAVGFRVRVVGRHRTPAALARRIVSLDPNELRSARGGLEIFVQKIRCEARGEIDLVATAQRDDPPGLLARRILALENGGAEADELLRQARQVIDQIDRGPSFGELAGQEPPAMDEVRGLLADVARRALSELLEAAEGSA